MVARCDELQLVLALEDGTRHLSRGKVQTERREVAVGFFAPKVATSAGVDRFDDFGPIHVQEGERPLHLDRIVPFVAKPVDVCPERHLEDVVALEKWRPLRPFGPFGVLFRSREPVGLGVNVPGEGDHCEQRDREWAVDHGSSSLLRVYNRLSAPAPSCPAAPCNAVGGAPIMGPNA